MCKEIEKLTRSRYEYYTEYHCTHKKTPNVDSSIAALVHVFSYSVDQFSSKGYTLLKKLTRNPYITVFTKANLPGADRNCAPWRMQRGTSRGGKEIALNSIRKYYREKISLT